MSAMSSSLSPLAPPNPIVWIVMLLSAAVWAWDRPPEPTPSVSRIATLGLEVLLWLGKCWFAVATAFPMFV